MGNHRQDQVKRQHHRAECGRFAKRRSNVKGPSRSASLSIEQVGGNNRGPPQARRSGRQQCSRIDAVRAPPRRGAAEFA